MSNITDKICHPVTSAQHLFEEVELPEGIRWSRIRFWAARNALTLIFLAALFIITWALQVLLVVIK